MNTVGDNIDPKETAKFNALAQTWWNPNGPLKTLHDINPVRLAYIQQRCQLEKKQVLDVGCGGGILSESLARSKAQVTALDSSEEVINVAKQHAENFNVDVLYVHTTVEAYAEKHVATFDLITCMEMLEHVPDPSSTIASCAKLLKPGGALFLSTINRNLKAYLHTKIIAEYLCRILPAGTHDYDRYIKPSELSEWGRRHGLSAVDVVGMTYFPLLRLCFIKHRPDVNYLMHLQLMD